MTLWQTIGSLFSFLGSRHQHQLGWLLGLMILVGICEVCGVASSVPFLMALTNLDRLFNHPKMQLFLKLTGITAPDQLLVVVIIGFIGVTVITNLLRITSICMQNILTSKISCDLSQQMYTKIMAQPYLFYNQHHTSEIVQSLLWAKNLAANFSIPILLIISNSFIVLFLMIGLLLIDGQVAVIAGLVLASTYGLLYQWRKYKLTRNSVILTETEQAINQLTMESLGNIKDILLGGQQGYFSRIYTSLTNSYNQAQTENQTIFLTPRYFLEAVAITSISLLALTIGQRGIPVLGSFAIAANRLLPAFQQIFSCLGIVQAYQEQMQVVITALQRPIDPLQALTVKEPFHFREALVLDQVWFRYNPDDRWVLKDLSLRIPARTAIGFVGTTGSGKSTTADLILGLLTPEKGRVLVDGQPLAGERLRAWQQTIAHVPQAIFIADTTILENIALGIDPAEIDYERAQMAARLAQLEEFILSLEQGYATHVGERGVRLSGGQRQRLGIARALYRQAQVLVFDEATSALDNTTEREVMKAIKSLSHNLTIIMIAHRLSTIEKCDLIYEFHQGQVIHQGTYQELLEQSPSFKKMAIG
ncbi:MAG: ABC transporter ATP-binding protein [Pseudanabaenaceae cyanobacterium]